MLATGERRDVEDGEGVMRGGARGDAARGGEAESGLFAITTGLSASTSADDSAMGDNSFFRYSSSASMSVQSVMMVGTMNSARDWGSGVGGTSASESVSEEWSRAGTGSGMCAGECGSGSEAIGFSDGGATVVIKPEEEGTMTMLSSRFSSARQS